MKRLDLLDSEVNGNKYFKLKYNIERALALPEPVILTFGGAHSNHIHAVAAAGKRHGVKTIGMIRGDELDESSSLSSTLLFARECGMQLEFLTREAYAEKETEDFKSWLYEQYGLFHLVPEGGSNFLGINGCMEILSEEDKSQFDIIACAMGTGATVAGLLLSIAPHQRVWGFPVLKNATWMRDEVIKHLEYFLMDREAAIELCERLDLFTSYDFGGYAKHTEPLLQFAMQFFDQEQVPLDQVYMAKMMYGLKDVLEKSHHPEALKVLAIHTGGLQGLVSSLTQYYNL